MKFHSIVLIHFECVLENQTFIVIGGRRQRITLGSILQFCTGTDEEPIVGYTLHPRLIFTEAVTGGYGFLPRANTCINQLCLPCPSIHVPLANEELLFEVYDMAFSGSHFGQK